MDQIKGLEAFVRIAEAGGIGIAAQQMGIAKSAVSRRLSELEKSMGVQLLNRTTRSSHLTEAGIRCYEYAIQVLDAVSELNMAAGEEMRALHGTLRIAVPLSFALRRMMPAIDEFARRHPHLNLDVNLADHFVDLVATGIDVAIRIGELSDSSLKARRIAETRMVLVASPKYLTEFGTPEQPGDLFHHPFLNYESTNATSFKITDQSGSTRKIPITARISGNNGDFLNEMAIRGHGLTLSPLFISQEAIERGELVALMADYDFGTRGVYAIYPLTRFVPLRVRQFIDYLANHFKGYQ